MTETGTQPTTDYAGAFAEHLVRAELSEIPARAIERAKLRMIDSIGNVLAGVDATGNAAARDVFVGYGGRPDSKVIGAGVKLPAPHAALLNAMAMRSYDFEAVGAEAADESMVAAHISGTTVAVGLAAAERRGATGAEFLLATILGEDIASRLAVASGFNTASGGDNTGTVNVMGGAAIVGKLEGFGVRQYRDAFGHALNQMAGTVQSLFDKADSFKLPQSLGARNAIVAADLANAGFTGLEDAIGSAFGFFRLFSPDPRPEQLLIDLGEQYFADMIIKPWSSCRAAHPALDGTLRLRNAHGLVADDVEAVEVHVTPTTKRGFTAQDFAPNPRSEVDGMFSIPYNVAVGMLEGTVRPEHLGVDYMNRPDVRSMLDRVVIIDSLPPEEYQTAEVVVVTKDGARHRQRVDGVLGDIYRSPLGDDAVLEKFRLNAEFGGRTDSSTAERIIDTVMRIDEVDGVSALIELLP